MSIEASLQKNKNALALKGGMFTLTSIQLLDTDLTSISDQLDDKIKQAPNFFLYAPVILDLQRIGNESLDFLGVVALCKTKKMIPIGVRGVTKTQREEAIAAGVAIFPDEKVVEQAKASDNAETLKFESKAANSSRSPTRIITQPIRSGQQIYVPGGDLIVMASVGHGAELLADGNIHVHGALRGRALAGVMGDKNAMIYCKSLEAELVSVAGQYRISEDLKDSGWKQSVIIQLDEGKLQIKSI